MTLPISFWSSLSMDRIVVEPACLPWSTILEFLADDSIDDMLAQHPSSSREDVPGCLAVASELMKHVIVTKNADSLIA